MQKELQTLNLSYLLIAQRLLAEDRETAILQLGISDEVADYISSMSTDELAHLSRVNQGLFTLRFSDRAQLENVVRNKRNSSMVQAHAALLLASDPSPA